MRAVKRIVKIHEISGYKVYCLFNNGESRIVDFERIFKEWGVKKGDTEYILASSREEFERVEIVDGTFVWNNVKIESIDENGEEIFYPYDLDPIVMYEMSKADSTRKTEIGLMIKQARKELGLTQRELAEKSGTSKHYISRIENNRSGIELSTLIRIIEGGLGRRLQINIV